VYDGTAFHRVVPGFVVQGGYLATRKDPLDERQQSYVRTLQPEFNDTKHDRGILSMARGPELASATTSFFIVLAPADSLDGKYTAFGRVVDGLEVVERMEVVTLEGETPVKRIDVTRRARYSGELMLKGSRDAVLHRMQPVSIHGQLFYDLHYRFVDEPDSQMRVARVGGEALGHAIAEGGSRASRFSCRGCHRSPSRRVTVS
jgi:cyclophilin family peptidyl-prolyl cis-trans isomerase